MGITRLLLGKLGYENDISVIIFILGCSVCSAPAGNHVFLCRKCSVIAIKNTRPNTSNCSSTGSHQWTDLGLEGEKIYLCQKCQKIVKMSSKPNTSNCPASGSHIWNYLGQYGHAQYQCRKCRIRVFTDKMPNSNNCLSGGSHQWSKF